MTYLQRANLDGFLAWQEKFLRGWVQREAYGPITRRAWTTRYEHKRAAARAWLANNKTRVHTNFDARVIRSVIDPLPTETRAATSRRAHGTEDAGWLGPMCQCGHPNSVHETHIGQCCYSDKIGFCMCRRFTPKHKGEQA